MTAAAIWMCLNKILWNLRRLIAYGSPEFCQKLINTMRESGIHVIIKENVEEHFAVLDDELVWHGGMNLLGKEDVWDNLMRVRSAQIAAELLEIALKEK